jgi:hypothetical protein
MTKGLPFTENAIQRVVAGARKTGAIKLPYLSFQTNRHGKEVVFVRRRGCRIRLHQTPGTSEFLNEYKAIIDGLSPPARPTKSDDQAFRTTPRATSTSCGLAIESTSGSLGPR